MYTLWHMHAQCTWDWDQLQVARWNDPQWIFFRLKSYVHKIGLFGRYTLAHNTSAVSFCSESRLTESHKSSGISGIQQHCNEASKKSCLCASACAHNLTRVNTFCLFSLPGHWWSWLSMNTVSQSPSTSQLCVRVCKVVLGPLHCTQHGKRQTSSPSLSHFHSPSLSIHTALQSTLGKRLLNYCATSVWVVLVSKTHTQTQQRWIRGTRPYP